MSLYKGNNLISGHQVLYSTTGQNTDGAMTQKAVSDELDSKIDLDYSNADYQPINKTGDTMTGRLLIETAVVDDALLLKNIGDNSTASVPSENQLRSFRVINNDGTVLGDTRFAHLADGSTQAQLLTRNYITGSPISASFSVTLDSSGKASCSFPNTARCDGQWIKYNQTVMNSVNLNGSTALTYTLSLPNDGYKYEVLLSGTVTTNTTAGNAVLINLSTSVIDTICMCWNTNRVANGSVRAGGSVIVPVSTDHKIYIARATDFHGTASLTLRAYRRIGTNS